MHKCLDSNSEDDYMSQHSKDIRELGDYYFDEDLEESKLLEESIIEPS
jgi:hypothetical protein